MDAVDIKLLAELERDADRPNVAVAAAIGLSPAATLTRVKRLKEAGVIRKVAAEVDAEAVGFPLHVYVAAELRAHDERANDRFARAVQEIPQVVRADWVTGEIDAFCEVVARSIAELQRVLLLLSSRGGATRVTTLLRLEVLKPQSPLPYDVSG